MNLIDMSLTRKGKNIYSFNNLYCCIAWYFNANTHTHTHTHTHVYIYIYIYIYEPQYIYIYIYIFCGLQYVGRPGQRLDARVKQHAPTKIWQGNSFVDHINNTYGSAIAEHLINNRDCASTYSADLFTILSRSHSDLYLKVLEAVYILTHKPSLCKQRQCLLGLNVITI